MQMNRLFWSEQLRRYADFGLHTDAVKLGRNFKNESYVRIVLDILNTSKIILTVILLSLRSKATQNTSWSTLRLAMCHCSRFCWPWCRPTVPSWVTFWTTWRSRNCFGRRTACAPWPRVRPLTWRKTRRTTRHTGEVPFGSTSITWPWERCTTTPRWTAPTRTSPRKFTVSSGPTLWITFWSSTKWLVSYTNSTMIKRGRARAASRSLAGRRWSSSWWGRSIDFLNWLVIFVLFCQCFYIFCVRNKKFEMPLNLTVNLKIVYQI